MWTLLPASRAEPGSGAWRRTNSSSASSASRMPTTLSRTRCRLSPGDRGGGAGDGGVRGLENGWGMWRVMEGTAWEWRQEVRHPPAT